MTQPTGPGDVWGTPTEPTQPSSYAALPSPTGKPITGYANNVYGPPGQIRGTGISMLLFAVTIGIYGYVYNYKVHDEIKRHSGLGLGGGIALLLTFVANIAMPFLTPNEVGGLYSRRGEKPPVRAWTGLWVILCTVAGYAILIVTIIANVATSTTTSTTTDGYPQSSDIALGDIAGGLAAFFVLFVTGGAVWFVKTNGALNRYWASMGVRAR
jgi:hypothetical protein